DIYKVTLLRLYQQFNSALLQDVVELKNIQATISGTNADPQNALAAQINKLKAEQGIVAEKIQTMASDAPTTATVISAPVPEPAATGPIAQVVATALTNRAAASTH